MSIVFEPSALLMLIDPSPAKVIEYYVIYKTHFFVLITIELTVLWLIITMLYYIGAPVVTL